MELSCGMWIPAGTLAHADEVVERMIRAVAMPGHGSDGKGVFDVVTQDTRPIGGRRYESSAALYCVFETIDRDEDAEQEVEAAFGFRPEPGSYAIGSDDATDDGNRMLAEFAAFLAEQVGGVVEFGCFPEDAAGLPGRTHALREEFFDWSRWRVVLDATAMRAWSRDPRCLMCREGKRVAKSKSSEEGGKGACEIDWPNQPLQPTAAAFHGLAEFTIARRGRRG